MINCIVVFRVYLTEIKVKRPRNRGNNEKRPTIDKLIVQCHEIFIPRLQCDSLDAESHEQIT